MQARRRKSLSSLDSRFRAGPSGEIFLPRMTCAGLGGNGFKSSCADLIRVSTSLFQPLQGVDGRHKAGQDEIGKAISFPSAPRDFHRIALRFRGNDGEERKVDRIHPEAINSASVSATRSIS